MANERERFLSKVFKNPINGCWEWTASVNEFGYGRFRVGGRAGQSVKAHRFSYELHVGPIAEVMNVLHKCDNPKCVNPEHLFLGTMKDNTQDMLAKGRNVVQIGEEASRAVLTEAQVIEIRRKRSEGRTLRSLGEEYGVGHMTIHAATSGKSWTHI